VLTKHTFLQMFKLHSETRRNFKLTSTEISDIFLYIIPALLKLSHVTSNSFIAARFVTFRNNVHVRFVHMWMTYFTSNFMCLAPVVYYSSASKRKGAKWLCQYNWPTGWTTAVQIPGRGSDTLSSPRPDRLCGPRSFLFTGYCGLFPQG